jgi:hypothetical protein
MSKGVISWRRRKEHRERNGRISKIPLVVHYKTRARSSRRIPLTVPTNGYSISAALASTLEVRGGLTKRSTDTRGADDEGHGVELHGDVCGVWGGGWGVCEAGRTGRMGGGVICDGTKMM